MYIIIKDCFICVCGRYYRDYAELKQHRMELEDDHMRWDSSLTLMLMACTVDWATDHAGKG